MPAPYATQLEWLSELDSALAEPVSLGPVKKLDAEIEALEAQVAAKRAEAAELVARTNRTVSRIYGEARVDAALLRFAKKITQGTCQTTEVDSAA